MSELVTEFNKLNLKSETEDDIRSLKGNLCLEINHFLKDVVGLVILADRYFDDAQRAYKLGFEGLCEQYLWAYRWAMSIEYRAYDDLPKIVGRFSEGQCSGVSFIGCYFQSK